MLQSTITHYFKKEVQIDWDEADNCYGENIDIVEQEEYTVRVVLQKLSDSVLQKYSCPKNVSPPPAYRRNTQKCSRCQKLFKHKESLRTHSYYCGKERNLQCAHCSYKTKHKKSLIIHLSKRHPEGKITQPNTDAESKFSRICQKCSKTSESCCPTQCEKCFGKLLYQCIKCTKQFETHSTAYYHWGTRCGVKGYFNCPKCDYKSVWRSKVVNHMKRLHQISASSKDFESIQWIGLNHNIQETSKSSSYQCPKCTKTMESSGFLSRHIRSCGGSDSKKNSDMTLEVGQNIHLDVRLEPNKCSICGEEFGHIYTLNRHLQYCQKIPLVTRLTDDNDIEVVQLDEDLPFKSPVWKDKRSAKTKEMTVKYCNKCQEETAIENSWCIDRKLSCYKCKSTLRYKCKKCLKEFSTYKSILRHVNDVCDSEEVFKCTKCKYTASNAIYVRSHYRSVHGNSNIECKKCGKTFKSNFYLQRHLRRCGVEPKFQCEHCPFKAKLKIYLRKHIFRSHMEPVVIDRREVIKISRQRFSRAMIHLKAHCSFCKKEQRLSDRLKNCRMCKRTLCYKCKTCKKNYVGDDDNACDHVKGYLETIKFECTLCGRGAISEKSLWGHKHICGVEPKFRCKFCKYTSKLKGNLMKHEKIKHPHKVQSHVSDAE